MLSHRKLNRSSGFSLIEMAIVLVIIGLLLGGILVPLSSQNELKRVRATEQQLQEITDALIGFAALNGRLPCPASNTSNGQAAPNTATTSCTTEHGFLPARTLGLDGQFNSANQATDAWNNPIRYSLTSANGGAYSNTISANLTGGNYRICSKNSCTAAEIIAENVVVVVCSRGKDGAQPISSANQSENADNDTDFVKATYSEATNNEFDDICRWISPNVIALELLRAGKL